MVKVIYKHKELDNLEFSVKEIERLVIAGERLNLKAFNKQYKLFGVVVYQKEIK